MMSLLAEAAGNEFDRNAFDGNAAARQLMIDHLESLGYVEAHCGLPGSDEVEDLYYLDGITTIGRAALAELQRNLNVEANSASDADANKSRQWWRKLLPVAVILIVASSIPIELFAQDVTTISTDRPGQTTPPGISKPGTIQIEASVQLVSDRVGIYSFATTTTTLSIPGALMRIGVLDRMELRIGTEFRSVSSGTNSIASPSVSELAGISLGTKIGITAEDGALPESSVLITLGMPEIGDEAFRPAAVAPSVTLLMHYTLSESFNLHYNLGGVWNGSQGEGVGTYSVLLSPAFTSSLLDSSRSTERLRPAYLQSTPLMQASHVCHYPTCSSIFMAASESPTRHPTSS